MNANMDMLIEDTVGEAEDYIEMAAAAYNAYKPGYEYSQEDLEDLAEEYMEAYADDLRTWETADSLKNWDESDAVKSQSRWESKVDDKYFAEV